MKSKFELRTPVLYLAFNRLNSVKKTFPEVQKVKPKELFVACDGPRTKEEKKKTNAVRKYILKNINWRCKVKTLFRDENLGCKNAVGGAIDWFFESVDEGIVLEDDCLPGESFFKFCQEMLEKYRDESRVMSISGYNILGKSEMEESYWFSKYFYCWGWATWKRSWEKVDLEMNKYKVINKKDLKNLFSWPLEKYLYKKRFNDNIMGRINSWAMSFMFSQMHNKGLSIVPKNNLVENIGFSKFSTHTKENKYDSRYLHHLRGRLGFPLKHPSKAEQNKKFDWIAAIQDAKRVFLKKIGH